MAETGLPKSQGGRQFQRMPLKGTIELGFGSVLEFREGTAGRQLETGGWLGQNAPESKAVRAGFQDGGSWNPKKRRTQVSRQARTQGDDPHQPRPARDGGIPRHPFDRRRGTYQEIRRVYIRRRDSRTESVPAPEWRGRPECPRSRRGRSEPGCEWKSPYLDAIESHSRGQSIDSKGQTVDAPPLARSRSMSTRR